MKLKESIKRSHAAANTAETIRRYLFQKRLLKAALGILLTAVIVLYIVAVLYMRTGSFTVSVNKYDMVQKGLSLSESRTMDKKTVLLNAEIVEDVTNISGSWLPENIDMIDGVHNGENHIAYTFYLQNTGTEIQDYEYSLVLSNITQDLDEAIRIRLYLNGKPVTYARTRSDGGGPEPGTKEFYSDLVVLQERRKEFRPNVIDKFTVVIWIEGNDPDCIDNLIGGQLRAEMKFSCLE